MTEDSAYIIRMALRNIKLSISDEMNEQLKPWFDDIEKAIEDEQMITKALSQEPCTDTVSREFMFKVLGDFCGNDRTATITLDTLADIVYELPSITHKSGKWIEETKRECVFSIKGEDYECREYGNEIYLHCSNCGWKTGRQANDFNYCPNCGERMEGSEE